MTPTIYPALLGHGTERLACQDPTLYAILEREYQRQSQVLTLVASSSVVDPSVLSCTASVAVNVTAEGYPGRRYHAGCVEVDKIEQLAIDRAKVLFGAQFANVQPHSASSANEIVMASALKPGDTILGMALNAGGHLTHGAKVSFSGIVYNAIGYGVGNNGMIDYQEIRRLALLYRPKLIICGTTAYPRVLDFARFRAIADDVGAKLLADISHIAGLVVTGIHPSPINHAHFTTTCTHKQLYGPRGGLILMGRDHNTIDSDDRCTLSESVQKAVFPRTQGAPILNNIAGKARAFAIASTPAFHELAARILRCAQALAETLKGRGYDIVTGGTDNHMVIVDVLRSRGITGVVAEQGLEACDIVVNKNRIAGDNKSASIASGIRLGTNTLAARGFESDDVAVCAALVDRVLSSITPISDREFYLDPRVQAEVRAEVHTLCAALPIGVYAGQVLPSN
jgi:glycine hydroxymethyltransferase